MLLIFYIQDFTGVVGDEGTAVPELGAFVSPDAPPDEDASAFACFL
jgi:hypothetical protein